MTVAIVTDSGSDLTPEQLSSHSITQVPLTVSFGDESFLSPDEIAPEEFWKRMRDPSCPFARTAAPSVGQFKTAFEAAFAAGHDAIVCVCLSAELSSTIEHAHMARDLMPGKNIVIVDSRSACMAEGSLVLTAADMAANGQTYAAIARRLDELIKQTDLYVALDTLDYLRKGGRIGAAKAAIGGLLSVKPIITVVDGVVVVGDQPRTRTRAMDRVIELLTDRPLTRLHVMYSPPTDPDALREAILAQCPQPAPTFVTTQMIGPVIGAHVGPGAFGATLVREG